MAQEPVRSRPKPQRLRTNPPQPRAAARAAVPDPTPEWRSRDRAAFVVEVLGGTRRAARVLDVAASQPSRWASGVAVPDPENARTLIDLDYVLALALQQWTPEVARDWLETANAHLDGARPLDVVRLGEPAAVVDALRAEHAGAYA